MVGSILNGSMSTKTVKEVMMNFSWMHKVCHLHIATGSIAQQLSAMENSKVEHRAL